jgi:phytoene dehydrogenase-like protein
MMPTRDYDAIIVGSGPNGLSAAINLARTGRSVMVFEAAATPGGGTRTEELTLPGFLHDVCSAIHPLGQASPFFRTLPLKEHGLSWIHPPLALAHPFDDGSAATLSCSIAESATTLGPDADAYQALMQPFVDDAEKLIQGALGPLTLPRHPLLMARFGLTAGQSALGFARRHFQGERARAIFGSMAAHAMLPLESPPTATYGVMLAVLAHAVGWPMAAGGSKRITDALVSILHSLGGEIAINSPVESIEQLPSSRAIVFDVTPHQLLEIAGNRFPASYRRQLAHFRYGPGVFKVDLALDGPIPWRAEECALAGTVHLGGTLDEVAWAEGEVFRGRHPERPFVLLAQQSRFDASRAPAGKQTVWAYCHVPNGSTIDMTARIEAQIERFAPGFRERILARHVMSPGDLQRYNANYVGGDINGGLQNLRQLFSRPALRLNPYTTPDPTIFIGSSSTPPGGGVHGLSGYFASQSVIRRGL